MRKLLIIKTGTTLPAIYSQMGDFEDFIINQLGIPGREVLVAPVYAKKALPEPKELSSIIITGSGMMVTDRADWSEYTAEWLRNLNDKVLPILGICYGHQLLAQAYGGVVDYHPQGKEVGTVSIDLTAKGKTDRLFKVLPSPFLGHASHRQTVVKLPPNATVLAQNSFEPCHGFTLNGNIWGVQFHPEFTAPIARLYLEAERESLEKSGHNFAALYAAVQDNPYGKSLLRRFLEIE